VVLEHHREVAVLGRHGVHHHLAVRARRRLPVISSSPAISRSVVVLPQPDGPTSTRSSWSFNGEIGAVDRPKGFPVRPGKNLGQVFENDARHGSIVEAGRAKVELEQISRLRIALRCRAFPRMMPDSWSSRFGVPGTWDSRTAALQPQLDY